MMRFASRPALNAHPAFAGLEFDAGWPVVWSATFICSLCENEFSAQMSDQGEEHCPVCGLSCRPSEEPQWIGPADPEARALWASLPARDLEQEEYEERQHALAGALVDGRRLMNEGYLRAAIKALEASVMELPVNLEEEAPLREALAEANKALEAAPNQAGYYAGYVDGLKGRLSTHTQPPGYYAGYEAGREDAIFLD